MTPSANTLARTKMIHHFWWSADGLRRRAQARRCTSNLSFILCLSIVTSLPACTSVSGFSDFGEVAIVLAVYDDDGIPTGEGRSGTVDVEVRAFLLSGTFPTEIVDGASVTLDLATGEEVQLGESEVRPGFYDGLQLRFTEVSASLVSGDPPVETSVTVDFDGAATLVVERTNSLLVAADGRVEIVVELNADVWLALANVSGEVEADDFASAVTLSFRND